MSANQDASLVYLHGYMGSSQSHKAMQTREWMQINYPAHNVWVPDLPHEPASAIALITDGLREIQRPVFIGSSMGGFYANYFSEKLGVRAAMINPAVFPHRLLFGYLGPQQSPYTGERFTLTEAHLQQLRELCVETMRRPALRMVLLQTGDETLDYREAQTYYQQSYCKIEPGGDHSFVDFPRYLPEVVKFLFDLSP